jgi:hypothetical protein
LKNAVFSLDAWSGTSDYMYMVAAVYVYHVIKWLYMLLAYLPEIDEGNEESYFYNLYFSITCYSGSRHGIQCHIPCFAFINIEPYGVTDVDVF